MTLVINQCQLTSGGSGKTVSENLILSRQFSFLFFVFFLLPLSPVTVFCDVHLMRGWRTTKWEHLLTLLNFNILFRCSLEWKSTDIDTSDFPQKNIWAWSRRPNLHKRNKILQTFIEIIIFKKGFSVCGVFPFMSLGGNLFNPHIMMTTSNTHCRNPF